MSNIMPDVVGCCWDEALEKLEESGFQVVNVLISGPRQIGILRRIIRQKQVAEGQVELVVAYFEPPKD